MASNADVTNIASNWKEQLKDLVLPEFDADDVRETLGSGLYGETSVVVQSGVSYITKKIHTSVFAKDEFRKSFAHDCLQLSQLRHPHVVQFLGVQIEDSPPTLVSELYPLSLSCCLQKYPEMPAHSKYTVLLETAVGIDYLHGLSPPVVHGHLTPNNVLLTEGLHVKIADCMRFGLDITPASNSPYQAPEEVQGEAGDVFSLGDIMLHVVLLREPSPLQYKHHRNLENKNEPVILLEIKRREHFLSEVDNTNLLKGLVLHCLEEDPAQRPSPKSLVQDLSSIVKDHEPEYHTILEMFVALGQLSLMKDSVSSHEETVKAKEEEIEALKEQMEPLHVDISAKDEALSAVKEEMESYKQALQSKEGRIKAHETGVRAKGALLKAKDRELAAKKQVLASKESLLKSANKRIASLEQHVKSSRKKGGNPPLPIVLPDIKHVSDHGSQPLSPESTSSNGHFPASRRPAQPYRGTNTSPIQTDSFKLQSSNGPKGKNQVADPQLANILARRQKRINDSIDSIHENKDGETKAPPIRKRSDVPLGSTGYRNILQKRKSLLEDESN